MQRYWKEQVLPLLKHHSIVLVRNADTAPAADCFVLIRLAAAKEATPGTGKQTKRLLVVHLQMKDYSLASDANVEEEIAKLGFTIPPSLSVNRTKQASKVRPILKRALAHQEILKKVFQREFDEVVFGAAMCTPRARPTTEACTRLEEALGGRGVMYATPVLQHVFHATDAAQEGGVGK